MRALTDGLWKLQCKLNHRLPGSPEPLPPAEFLPRGASVDPRTASSNVAAPELCIVITTHKRVEPCLQLLRGVLETLRVAGLTERAFVVVLEDPSAQDYTPGLDLLAQHFPGRFAFFCASRHLGKPGRWFGYQTAFDFVRALRPAYTLFLEDDAEVSPTFVRDALSRWAEIDDPDKTVLYLCRFEDDEPQGRWVRFARREMPGARVQLTQWFDLHAFLVTERFFRCLNHELFRPWASRWQHDPSRSSGVSEQFTRRLFGRGNIYQVCQTLALHGRAPSVLNEQARSVRPLNNVPERSTESDELVARASAPRAR